MKKIILAASVVLLALTPSAAQAAPPTVSVVGSAEIDTVDVPSTFDFRVQARGDGRSGSGVIILTHHNETMISWAVARVDCVRRYGRSVVVVTGVVGDAQDFAAAGPGDPISLSVRDGSPDLIGFGSGDGVRPCRGPLPDRPVDRGDFRVDVAAAASR